MKQRIAFFDFDGTITFKDTYLEFIKYTKGTLRFITGFYGSLSRRQQHLWCLVQ